MESTCRNLDSLNYLFYDITLSSNYDAQSRWPLFFRRKDCPPLSSITWLSVGKIASNVTKNFRECDRNRVPLFSLAKRIDHQQNKRKPARDEPPMTEEQPQANINEIQRLHFELFRRVRYNLLDGERVVRDLLEWHDLWYKRAPHAFSSLFQHTRWQAVPPLHGAEHVTPRSLGELAR